MELEKGGISTTVTTPADIALYKQRGWVEVITPVEPDEKPLEKLTVAELKELAKEKGIEGFEDMKKADLLIALNETAGE
jgi:large subunit ribosomal protein L21